MNKRDQPGPRQIKVNKPTAEPKRWRTYFLIAVCGLTLVSGFFFAGRQHFSSMDYGMKNSKLRRQVDDLEAEKRRLMLAREVSLSPAEIKKAAKKSGILDQTIEGVVAQIASATTEKAVPSVLAATPLVIKTAAVMPARPAVETADLKADKAQRPVKKTVATE